MKLRYNQQLLFVARLHLFEMLIFSLSYLIPIAVHFMVYGRRVVGPMHWLHFTPQKHYFSATGTHFHYRLSEPEGLVWLEILGRLKKIYLIGSRTCNFPACSIVSTTSLPWTSSVV
jgi:hypothetical protein